MERSDGRFGEHGVGDCGSKGEFIDGGPDGCHDTLSAHSVEVLIFVVAAAQIEHFEVARYGCRGPFSIAEMSVADDELSESGYTEERRKT